MKVRPIPFLVAGLCVTACLGMAVPFEPAVASPRGGQDEKASAPATQAPAPQETHMRPLRVESRLVQVSVRVIDKNGNPLAGLTKDNFVIFDEKKQQTIGLFTIHTNQPSADAADPLPPDTYTNNFGGATTVPANVAVILLDALNTDFLDQARVRGQVVKYLKTIQPSDRVALYMLRDHLQVLHDFTSDASDLIKALDQYKGGMLSTDLSTPETSPQNTWNRALVATAADAGINESQAVTPNRLALTTEALRLIADHVGGLPGRKSLIWVAGDFPFNLEMNNLERTREGERLPYSTGLELTARALINANIAIYPVDAHGLATGGWIDSGVVQASDMTALAPMRTLAARTGGRPFYSTNDIMGSIRKAISDSELTYELGFYPADVKWDGSFRAIRVKVNVPGAEVFAREGYFALGDSRDAPETRMALMSEAAKGPLQATELSLRAHVSASRDNDETVLALDLGIDPRQFSFEENNGTWKDLIEFAFLQFDQSGRIVRTTRRSFPMSLDIATLQELRTQGLSLQQELHVAQGVTQLRVIVLDGGRGKVGSVQVPLASYVVADKR